jgi:general secretion pathway protein G
MQFYSVRKRMITLIEIMIVMFLIALITGVLAYNYRGSLEEGKVFKTQAAMQKLETILNLAVAQDPRLQDGISEHWRTIVESSPLVHNAKDLEYDGWGYEYKVEKNNEGKIEIISEGYNNYLMKKPGR